MYCNDNRNGRGGCRESGAACGSEMALASNLLTIRTSVVAGENITTSPILVNIPVDVRYFLRSTTADCALTGTCDECCEG